MKTIIFCVIISVLLIIIAIEAIFLKVYYNLCIKYVSDIAHAQELEKYAEMSANTRVEYFKNMITNAVLDNGSVKATLKKLGYGAIVQRILDDQDEKPIEEKLKFWDE